MIRDINFWMDLLVKKLLAAFGGRVVFVGLQGSYNRGEANESSDIDAMLVLDRIDIISLKQYKDILRTMPENEKICGFTCGREELRAWARPDLFHLLRDTSAYYGNLEELIGEINREDIITGVKMSLSGIYHEVCHRYLHKENLAEQAKKLKTAYKTVYYILQDFVYLETGKFIPSRIKLKDYLSDKDAEILGVYDNWEDLRNDRAVSPEIYFSRLVDWCGGKLVSI